MTLDELRSSRRGEILGRANAWGARNVRVFGSLSRGDNKPESDIDFLIDLDPDRTLMDLGGVLTELQQMLQVPVDVTTEKFSGRTFGIARCAMQSRYERRSGTTGRHIQFKAVNQILAKPSAITLRLQRMKCSRSGYCTICRSSAKRRDACLRIFAFGIPTRYGLRPRA